MEVSGNLIAGACPCMTPVKSHPTLSARHQQQVAAVSHEATMADSVQVMVINKTENKLLLTRCQTALKRQGRKWGSFLLLVYTVI